MDLLQIVIYILIAITGTGVALTRDPLPQSIVVSVYGMLLSVLFVILQAPDVALSEIAVGAVVFPLLLLLALAKTRAKGAE